MRVSSDTPSGNPPPDPSCAVVAAGGRITREPFGYPGGRRFQFLDPADNELAIYQPR